MFTDYSKNFLIYFNNLSPYYVLCFITSLLAVLLSWILHFKNTKISSLEKSDIDFCVPTRESEKSSDSENEDISQHVDKIILTYKKSKKQKMDQIVATLTDEQKEEEKRAEREQLQAILNLIKEQQEKFQVGTIEELEGQLKLYR